MKRFGEAVTTTKVGKKKKIIDISQFPCPHCGSKFSRRDNLQSHVKRLHGNTKESAQKLVFHCGFCDLWFVNQQEINSHRAEHRRKDREQAEDGDGGRFFLKCDQAHGGKCAVYRLYFPPTIVFAHTALKYSRKKLVRFLLRQQAIRGRFKFNIAFHLEYVKLSQDGKTFDQVIVVPFRSDTAVISPFSPVDEIVHLALSFINCTTTEFTERGSGWAENEVLFLEVSIVDCQPLSGSCSLHSVSFKRGMGLTFNTDGVAADGEDDAKDCFYLAVARHFVKGDDVKALRQFIEENVRVTTTDRAPVALDDITKFEDVNEGNLDVGINVVYRDADKRIYPVRVTKRLSAKNTIVLLLANTAGENGVVEMHYAHMEEPDKMLAPRRKSGERGEGGLGVGNAVTRLIPALFCYNCFNYQSRRAAYEKHVQWCHQETGQRVIVPMKGDTVSYRGFPKKERKIGYTIFFDFETLQVEPEKRCPCPSFSRQELEKEMLHDTAGFGDNDPKVCTHHTKIIKEHHAFAYCLVMIDRGGRVVEERTYAGDDADVHFVETLLDLEEKWLAFIKKGGLPMKKMGNEERQRLLDEAKRCGLCGEPFQDDDENCRRVVEKVVHHDHVTGEFICVAHNGCNLHEKEELKFVAMAHNFSGYDSHIVVKALGNGFYHDVSSEEDEEKKKRRKLGKYVEIGGVRKRVIKSLSAIPLTTEKFKIIQLNSITMMDSAAFLPDSLDKLVQTLVASNHDFPYMSRRWSDPLDLALLKRKGCYPYSFATSIKTLNDATWLPPIEAFRNEIGAIECEDEDYAHAQNVWSHFKCQTMMDYTMLYVVSDTYQLAEVMLNMRRSVYGEFGLDVCQYWSLPMLSKDIQLKYTGNELELLHDQEMIQLFRRNIRGGLSFVNTRHYKAVEGLTQIVYVDKNNLYGEAQSLALPLRDFRWMTESELKRFDPLKDVTGATGPGYILEVTLRYPTGLHLEHSSFPLAPHEMNFTGDDLSPYAADTLDKLRPAGKHSGNYRSKKLTATFDDRVRYLCHGLNLQLYLQLGMSLVEIHRGITFHQRPYLKGFIDMCTKKRAASKTKSEGDICKLIANGHYGKVRRRCVGGKMFTRYNVSFNLLQLIEGVDKRMDCKFNRNEQKALRSFSDPLFKSVLICGDDLSITFHRQKEVRLMQHWAVGFSVLELSKYLMQSMYYNRIKPALNNACSVLMSDTDSFLIATEGSSVGEVYRRLSPLMDFSNYPPDHPLHSMERKNELGFIKNEVPGDEIVEFVGLKAKTYAFKTKGQAFHSRAKGVKKVYKKKIGFEQYLACLSDVRQERVKQVTIQSKKHQNMLIETDKVAFNSFDDKRFLTCAIHSVPYGSVFAPMGTPPPATAAAAAAAGEECYFCRRPHLLV